MELVEANPNDDELRAKLFECQCGSHFMKAFKWVNDDMLQVELFSNAQEEYKEVDPIITKSSEIRDLENFIKNENAYSKSLKDLENNILNIDKLKEFATNEDIDKLRKLKPKFIDILPAQQFPHKYQ